jgi:hypothetical protein
MAFWFPWGRRSVPASLLRLQCSRRVWLSGVAELRRRADGTRESGAFLLGTIADGTRTIREIVFYDDIDPHCFKNGIVEFDGRKLGQLWSHCRTSGFEVVADVHVHPGSFRQSPSDQRNPVMPTIGHVALILPNYARGRVEPGSIGIYEYLGDRRWRDHSVPGTDIMRLRRLLW